MRHDHTPSCVERARQRKRTSKKQSEKGKNGTANTAQHLAISRPPFCCRLQRLRRHEHRRALRHKQPLIANDKQVCSINARVCVCVYAS